MLSPTPTIIPVLNGLDLTRACVESVLAQDIPVSILLIDNGSSDGTEAWARELERTERRFEYARAMCPGVAASWNFGLGWALARSDAAWVINNDTVMRPDTLRHLLADGGGFVTAVSVREPERIRPPYIAPDPSRKRPHPDFSCFLIRRETYELVGPFDENFKMAYAEDSDYHVRMHRAGIHAECLEISFLHVDSGSGTIKRSTPAESIEICCQADRNREYFFQKWGFRVGSPEYYAHFSESNFGVTRASQSVK